MKPYELLKKLRKATGLNQSDMATALEMSRPNYGQKENGNVPLSADEFFEALSFLKEKVPPKKYIEETKQLIPESTYARLPKEGEMDVEDWINDESIVFYGSKPKKEPAKEIIKNNSVTKIDFEHQELVKNFINKEKGLKANQLLIKLERLSKREFHKWVGDLEGLVEEIEDKIQDKGKTGTDSGDS